MHVSVYHGSKYIAGVAFVGEDYLRLCVRDLTSI